MKKFLRGFISAIISKIPVVGDINHIKSVVTEDSKKGEYKWSEALPRIIVTLAISGCAIFGMYKGLIEEKTFIKLMRMILLGDVLE